MWRVHNPTTTGGLSHLHRPGQESGLGPPAPAGAGGLDPSLQGWCSLTVW